MNKNYDDIINLPHHVSKTRPRMSLEQRSAQFAPFSALTGYEDEIIETGILTTDRIDLDEERKQILDRKLKAIIENISIQPLIRLTYFVPDNKKDGGAYVTTTGKVKKIDTYKNIIVLADKLEIQINNIIDIDTDMDVGRGGSK